MCQGVVSISGTMPLHHLKPRQARWSG